MRFGRRVETLVAVELANDEKPPVIRAYLAGASREETRRRLEGRATEGLEAMEARMTTAVSEVAARSEFDYEVVNDDRERAREEMIETIKNIVEREGGA